ncbi:MAG TPA: hypothetical protein VEA61_05365 [Allosphingosinicella sp.]|nr:hypothetical protein [Allosphingosinicella sp.]
MSVRTRLLACLAAAIPAGAAAQDEGLLAVQVLAEGQPSKERRVGPIQPFYRQDLLKQAGTVFRLSPDALHAFKQRHGVEDNDPVMLMEWLALPEGQPSRHIAYLHCARGGLYGTGPIKACFRDSDADGRIDAVADVHSRNLPAGGLRFVPIEPVPYDYVRGERKPLKWSMYVQPGLGLAYRRDRATGKLLFRAQALAAGLRADLEPFVEVDPSRLPTTIDIAGAAVAVLAWDGKRATVRVDRPMTDRPVRVLPKEASGLLPPRGSPKGWRLEIVDVPLPGTPR